MSPCGPATESAQCPALLVSAPASGQGKTLVTAALARRHRRAGRRVRVFKCGPDFLDPMILERASGAPVHQLDLFMVGEEECRRLLHEAAQDADVILVEGVMGLFDGDPSAADLAARFGLPVLAVLDGSAMAQTFGALVLGLARYRSDTRLLGVLANRVGSARHGEMLEESLPEGIAWLGALARDPDLAFPERHLGLLQADEIADLDARLDRAAASLPDGADWLPEAVTFSAPARRPVPARSLEGHTIAVARDAAFGFIYPANIACLEALGARIVYFSPLEDTALPACDAVWLPGGYPELHAQRLSANTPLITDLQSHHRAGKPILAECGGMLFCLETLAPRESASVPMAGLLPGHAALQPRLAALGLQEVALEGGSLRGHTFHYSTMETSLSPIAQSRSPRGRAGEDVFASGRLTATYMHLYFASAPDATALLFQKSATRAGAESPADSTGRTPQPARA
ncbi:cobyrinate a,c-diamide synthase [Novosphingobium decolorationis]|uniref:Cobyrinate a,c-diamide synthase n=1 Tax=Novosphingobium decolorationis TaxID=2698673 RepID=A0ABX8E4Z8_9SPHN|nr:cobyrinate a,c-diamide synthase [Novosphingobium decolorationis]QVM83121.1 cobyrinate a,c-diamide synthase [Novosphingobium decolorationis]